MEPGTEEVLRPIANQTQPLTRTTQGVKHGGGGGKTQGAGGVQSAEAPTRPSGGGGLCLGASQRKQFRTWMSRQFLAQHEEQQAQKQNKIRACSWGKGEGRHEAKGKEQGQLPRASEARVRAFPCGWHGATDTGPCGGHCRPAYLEAAPPRATNRQPRHGEL